MLSDKQISDTYGHQFDWTSHCCCELLARLHAMPPLLLLLGVMIPVRSSYVLACLKSSASCQIHTCEIVFPSPLASSSHRRRLSVPCPKIPQPSLPRFSQVLIAARSTNPALPVTALLPSPRLALVRFHASRRRRTHARLPRCRGRGCRNGNTNATVTCPRHRER